MEEDGQHTIWEFSSEEKSAEDPAVSTAQQQQTKGENGTENRGKFPLKPRRGTRPFDEWLKDFTVDKQGVVQATQWIKDDRLQDLVDLLQVYLKAALNEENLTDRYDLMVEGAVELYVARREIKEELDMIGPVVNNLLFAVYRLDEECGLDSGLTKEMDEDTRKAVIELLDEDEKLFEAILLEEYMRVMCTPYQQFVLELARCIHSFNGYQPPGRSKDEIHLLEEDLKNPVRHFDAVLDRLAEAVQRVMRDQGLLTSEDTDCDTADNERLHEDDSGKSTGMAPLANDMKTLNVNSDAEEEATEDGEEGESEEQKEVLANGLDEVRAEQEDNHWNPDIRRVQSESDLAQMNNYMTVHPESGSKTDSEA